MKKTTMMLNLLTNPRVKAEDAKAFQRLCEFDADDQATLEAIYENLMRG